MPKTRGRPPKFGRPARLVALTLPEDIIQELQALDRDIAKAVVSLVDQVHGRAASGGGEGDRLVALAHLGDSGALIVIDPTAFREIPGCSLVPLSERRAFLALEPGRSLADLELAIADRIADGATLMHESERRPLETLRRTLRDWRRDGRLSFHTRGIVLVDGATGSRP